MTQKEMLTSELGVLTQTLVGMAFFGGKLLARKEQLDLLVDPIWRHFKIVGRGLKRWPYFGEVFDYYPVANTTVRR